MKRLTTVIILLTVILFSIPAGSVEKIYFGDTGHDKIRRCNLDGSSIQELVTTGLDAVGCIAVDRIGGKMYWTDWPEAGSTIERADLDGSNVEILLTGLGGPYGIALDVAAGKMYFTEFSALRIRRANLDGTGVEDLVTAGLSKPQGIALDLINDKMYWADGTSEYSAKIMRADLDGSNVETLIPVGQGLIAPMELELDIPGGKMYWTDLGADSVMRADLDGSNLESIIASEYGTPVGLALDLAAGKLYFSDSGAGGSKIKRANLDGSSVQDLITSGIGACYGLTLGPAEPECGDSSLNGPWIAIVSGVEAYDYNIFMIFDGAGTMTDMGAFNVPYPAGTYAVAPDCSLSGTIWTDGYSPFTGYISSDSTAEILMAGIPALPLMKVSDPGYLEGCWEGHFIQDTTLVTWTVTLEIDGFGSIQSATGLTPPVAGKFFTEDGYLAGHIESDINGLTPQEFMLLDAVAVGDSVMMGTFGIDCGSCPNGTFLLTKCDITGVPDRLAAGMPVLHQNYPNPFNPSTTISFTLPAEMHADLAVYSPEGKLVKTLVNGHLSEGYKEVRWDGRNARDLPVGSGVYFYRLTTARQVVTRKMVLLK